MAMKLVKFSHGSKLVSFISSIASYSSVVSYILSFAKITLHYAGQKVAKKYFLFKPQRE